VVKEKDQPEMRWEDQEHLGTDEGNTGRM